MTNLKCVLAVFLIIFSAPLCVNASSLDWGVLGKVDAGEILRKYPTHQQRKQEWNKYKNRLKQQLQFQRQRVSTRLENLARSGGGQFPKKDPQSAPLRKRLTVLRVRERRIDKLIKAEHERLRKKTYERIDQVVQSLSEELQLPVLVQGEAERRRNHIFAPSSRDLTNRVLQKLK